MKRNFIALTILLTGLLICQVNAQDQLQNTKPEPGKQVPQTITVPTSMSIWDSKIKEWDVILKTIQTIAPVDDQKTEQLQYLLYLPENYKTNGEQKYPLMLFLHGAGERGTDLDKVKVHGPPMILEKHPEIAKKCPFIVVSPQCHEEHYWSPAQLLLLLDEIEKNYNIDQDRVVVTGLSMGGFGSWMLGAIAGDRLAAIAPICGGFDPEQADQFVNLPVWTFHGEKDELVPCQLSIAMVDAIKAKGGQKVKLTLYPEVNHGSWVNAYKTPELYEWLLAQNRKKNCAK